MLNFDSAVVGDYLYLYSLQGVLLIYASAQFDDLIISEFGADRPSGAVISSIAIIRVIAFLMGIIGWFFFSRIEVLLLSLFFAVGSLLDVFRGVLLTRPEFYRGVLFASIANTTLFLVLKLSVVVFGFRDLEFILSLHAVEYSSLGLIYGLIFVLCRSTFELSAWKFRVNWPQVLKAILFFLSLAISLLSVSVDKIVLGPIEGLTGYFMMLQVASLVTYASSAFTHRHLVAYLGGAGLDLGRILLLVGKIGLLVLPAVILFYIYCVSIAGLIISPALPLFLFVGALFNSASMVVGKYVLRNRGSLVLLGRNCVVFVVNFTLLYLLVPSYGPAGASIVFCLVNGFGLMISLRLQKVG